MTSTPRPVQSAPAVQAFTLADAAFDAVVQQVRPEQWDLVLPDSFQTGARQEDGDVTLRQVLQYHAYDEAWMPDMLAGRTMDEVGRDRYDGDLLHDDPAAYTALRAAATAAVEAVTDLDQPVHWSYGDFPLGEGLWHPTSFRVLRSVDLPRVLGFDDTLDPRLVELMWAELAPQAEYWRSMGVFGPAFPVADDAPLQQRMLGLAGRPPTR